MNPYALFDPFVALLHTALAALAAVLPLPTPGMRLVVALVLVTLALRVALLPLAVRAHRGARARAALAPRLAALRRRYAGDRSRLQAEVRRLHQDAGVPMTAGLLPGLAQLPVLLTIYRLLVVPTVAGSPNLVLVTHLFGAPMAAHWPEVVAVSGMLSPAALAVVLLFAGLLVLAVVSWRDAGRALASAPVPDTPQTATAQRVLALLPFGTLLVAAVTPVAMGIYLLTAAAWTVCERRLVARSVPA